MPRITVTTSLADTTVALSSDIRLSEDIDCVARAIDVVGWRRRTRCSFGVASWVLSTLDSVNDERASVRSGPPERSRGILRHPPFAYFWSATTIRLISSKLRPVEAG